MTPHKKGKPFGVAQGKVYLVGAGPGDSRLITLKGWERLKSSDVVVYDHLVNPDLLKLAHPRARLVFAGKKGSTPPHLQNRINRLLIREAKKGLNVLRLKGGDPYLFGRGAEEGSSLRKAGIDFEVIPGITSAEGCAAYAGIPLTERHLASSVAFITGHSSRGREGQRGIRWKALVEAVDTLVVYMGVSEIGKIRRELISHGCPPEKPVAVVQWGTYPQQRSIITTLGRLHEKLRHRTISPPAVMIIGEVVRLNKVLNWFESLPLFGKKVVITRARHQSGLLKGKLESLGAQVMELPTIAIGEPKDYNGLDRSIESIHEFDWLLFTSINGVDSFFNRLLHSLGKDARSLSRTLIGAVGLSTSERLKAYGVVPDFVPSIYTTQGLVSGLRQRYGSLKDKCFLLPRARSAPKDLEEELRRLGASVKTVNAYETRFPRSEILKGIPRLKKERFDFITFTSSSTVQNLVKAIGRSRLRALTRRARVVSMGPVTTKTLRSYRIRVDGEARVSTLEGMVEVMKDF